MDEAQVIEHFVEEQPESQGILAGRKEFFPGNKHWVFNEITTEIKQKKALSAIKRKIKDLEQKHLKNINLGLIDSNKDKANIKDISLLPNATTKLQTIGKANKRILLLRGRSPDKEKRMAKLS